MRVPALLPAVLKDLGELTAAELAALVGVEDLRLAFSPAAARPLPPK